MIVSLILKAKYSNPFLRHIFHCENDKLEISRNNKLGMFICSLVEPSPKPIIHTNGTILHIPASNVDSNRNKFLYISDHNQKRINDYIESNFMLYFESWMLQCRCNNISYTNAILKFLKHLNISEDPTIFDALKKKDYRNRVNIKKKLSQTLQCVMF